MALLAHYEVLKDGSFNLEAGEQSRLLFNPSDDAYLEDTVRRAAILSYTVDPTENAKDMELEVFARMGGKEVRVSVLRVFGGVARTVTEPINPSGFSKGDNRLTFKIGQGTGSVRISNVVMWYQRQVDNL